MPGLFRICRKARLPQDPSEGYNSEGRWHPAGLPVLYSCTSLPMCIFEMRADDVGFDEIRSDYHFSRCDADPAVSLETVPDSFYRGDWTLDQAASRQYGGDWLRSKRTLFLAVRSAPLQTETNYIINPAHPGFPDLVFTPPAPIPLDSRIS